VLLKMLFCSAVGIFFQSFFTLENFSDLCDIFLPSLASLLHLQDFASLCLV
jgi:hypothetical protein